MLPTALSLSFFLVMGSCLYKTLGSNYWNLKMSGLCEVRSIHEKADYVRRWYFVLWPTTFLKKLSLELSLEHQGAQLLNKNLKYIHYFVTLLSWLRYILAKIRHGYTDKSIDFSWNCWWVQFFFSELNLMLVYLFQEQEWLWAILSKQISCKHSIGNTGVWTCEHMSCDRLKWNGSCPLVMQWIYRLACWNKLYISLWGFPVCLAYIYIIIFSYNIYKHKNSFNKPWLKYYGLVQFMESVQEKILRYSQQFKK